MRCKKGSLKSILVFCLVALQIFPYMPRAWSNGVVGNGSQLSSGELSGAASGQVLNLGSVASGGSYSYAYPLELPPALLTPALALQYNSTAKYNYEMPYGWSLPIPNIERLDEKYPENEFRITAAELSGVLRPSSTQEGQHVLWSTSSNDTVARLQNGIWTVNGAGLVYTFIKPVDEAGLNYWRVSRISDVHGNSIVYHYTSEGRVDFIEYGGSVDGVYAPHAKVVFVYQNPQQNFYSAAPYGYLMNYDRVIEKIMVYGPSNTQAENSGSASQFLKTYKLIYGVDRSVLPAKKLVGIEENVAGKVEGGETISTVAFGYQKEEAVEVAPTTMFEGLTDSMGQACEKPGCIYQNSKTYTQMAVDTNDPQLLRSVGVTHLQEMMIDLNGDGLVDFLSQSTSRDPDMLWSYRLMQYDSNQEEYIFSSAQTAPAPLSVLGLVITSKSVDGSAPPSLYYKTLFRDVNTDGFADLMVCDEQGTKILYGDGIEDGVYPFFENEFVSMPLLPGDLRQDSNGHYSSITREQSPFLHQEHACWRSAPADVQTAQSIYHGADFDYVDMNQDGWLDIVQFRRVYNDNITDPSVPIGGDYGQFIYYHTGTKNGGWNADAVFRPARTMRFDGSIYTRKAGSLVGEYGEEINYVAVDVACEVVKHIDINGDGFLDEVLSGEAVENFNGSNTDFGPADDIGRDLELENPGDWVVAFGSKDGLMPEYHAWSVPEDSRVRAVYDDRLLSCLGASIEPTENNGGSEVSRLADMDSDGLLDLVILNPNSTEIEFGEAGWFKNVGNGFADERRNLPDYLVDLLMTREAFSLVSSHTDEYIGHDYAAYYEGGNSLQPPLTHEDQRRARNAFIFPPSVFANHNLTDIYWRDTFAYDFITKNYTHEDLIDVNGDGLPDFIDVSSPRSGEASKKPSGVMVPAVSMLTRSSKEPLLLNTIRGLNGLKTVIQYKKQIPSGNLRYPTGMSVVQSVSTSDPFTKQTKKVNYGFSHPRYVLGSFSGFDRMDTTTYLDGTYSYRTVTKYEAQDVNFLERDQYFDNRIKSTEVYADKNHVYAPHSTSQGQIDEYLAEEIVYNYQQQGPELNMYLPVREMQAKRGEYDGLPHHTLKKQAIYRYNFYGLIENVFEDYDGNDHDLQHNVLYQHFAYPAFDGDTPLNDATFALPQFISVINANNVEIGKMEYNWSLDGKFLNWQKNYSGRVDENEAVTASYMQSHYLAYSPRGLATEMRNEGSGLTWDVTYGYNGTIPIRISSSDGNLNEASLNKWGRMTTLANRNQSNATMDYDNFGRPLSLKYHGKLIQSFEYVNHPVSLNDQVWSTPNSVFVTNELSQTTVKVFIDGSGNVLESLVDAPVGYPGFISESFLYDLNGRLLMTLAPQTVSSQDAKTNYSSAKYFGLEANHQLPRNSEKVAYLGYYDAFGAAREYYSNYRENQTPVIIEHKEGNSFAIKSNNKGSLVITDQVGNPTEIRRMDFSQGLSQTVMGRYEYSPLGEIKKFTDREGNNFTYNYDALGRLIGSDLGGVVQYNYQYNPLGDLLSIGNSAGDVTAWTYDAFDRQETKTVSHPSGTPVEYRYSYYDENSFGKAGLLHSVTDGNGGETVYDYYPHHESLLSVYHGQ